MTTHTDQFVDRLHETAQASYSRETVQQVHNCLLDYLGATIVGSSMLGDKGARFLTHLGGGAEDAALIGLGRRSTLERAAYVNGLSSHVAEMDDGVRFGMMHPGAPIFSALLPVAEYEKVSGDAFVRGVVTGYEAAIRLSTALQPSHYARGFHTTGTCGVVGAAAGIAAMLGFDRRQMKDAISTAIVSAHGTLKVLEDKSDLKPSNVARAAHAGLIAAYMGRAGFSGPDDALAGKAGMCAMMADSCNTVPLIADAEEPFAIHKVYFKPYAACRHAHPSIEAALQLRAEHRVDLQAVEAITVTTYESVMGKHDHASVSTVASAKMSIPHSLAIALVLGRAGVGEFTPETVDNPEICELAHKVSIHPDADLSALVPDVRAAIVSVRLLSGSEYSTRVDYPKGEPENPMTPAELQDKFMSLCSYAGESDEKARRIAQAALHAEADLHALFALLT